MDEVETVLDMLGIEYETQGGEYRAHCPQHKARTGKEDSNPSWYINAETGLHICFSCHYKGNLISLVSDVRGIDIGQAQALVVGERTELDSSRIRERLERAVTWKAPRELDYYPESSLAAFDDPPNWALAQRRISVDSSRAYGVRWASGSWILPIRHPESNRLMGWQSKSQVTRAFVRNVPASVKKSLTLFGWHMVHPGDEVWVVESPLDAVLLYDYGRIAVATYGSAISKAQYRLLACIPDLVLAFDNDSGGHHATDAFLKYTRHWGNNLRIAEFPAGVTDPGECSDEQLSNLEVVHSLRRGISVLG